MRYFLLFLFVGFSAAAFAQNDHSLSPYFTINVDSGEVIPDFPLQSTSAEVEIAGIIADVTVTQVYTNHSQRPIEAVYVFPGSTNAAVYAMEMQIGRRTITAEIREKNAARLEYTEAKQNGQTASLLEQQRPNIFTMNVANIMPGDSIIVRMSYTERLVPTQGVYEFAYPTVVAPRYTGVGATDYNANLSNTIAQPAEGIPYSKKGVAPSYAFGMNVKISSAIPFEFVKSPTHKVLLSFAEKNEATVLLDKSETSGGNRDFVLNYRFAGGTIETGLMLYEGKEENFFMLMMQPPKRVPVDSIPPREYIFVMDVSGSMNGYPMETSKRLLRNLVNGLRPTDKFNVVQFAGGAALFSARSVDATKANVDSAIIFISTPQGSGGTELNSAMRTAMAIPQEEGYSRSIVIATDGLISAEAQVYQSMRDNLNAANVFAFGIGSSCNRYIIEGMAFCGNGEPFVVMQAASADSAAENFRRYISSPVLTDISVQYNGFDVYDVEPLGVPDLFAERPLIITGKYRGKPSGKIVVDGMTGAGAYHKELRADSVKPKKQNKAIRLLWARDRVKYLSYLDYPGYSYSRNGVDTTAAEEILGLGLKYGMLTKYTSFIAVDRRIRNKGGVADSTIEQTLPLPQGMENMSIGMYGNINSVVMVSGAVSVIDASYCSMQGFVSYCIILPSRPVLPHHALIAQEPVTVQDINWTHNGNYIRPVITANRNPMFTPGASARIAGRIPGDMLNNYTTGPTFAGNDIVPPLHGIAIGLNSWLYDQNQVTLMTTQKGNQSLLFSYNYVPSSSQWRHLFELGEQWNPAAIDFDKDGRMDFETGFGATLHERSSFTRADERKLQSVSNDVLIHWSSFSGGQPSVGYNTLDRTIGIYSAPQFTFRTSERTSLTAAGNFGYASLYNEWGADRFHLNTITAGVNTNFEWRTSASTWNFGGKFNVMSGDERWNTVALDQTYNSGALFAHYYWSGNNIRFNVDLRGEYDGVNGAIIIPGGQFIWQYNGWSVLIAGTRYRSAPFTIGQLTPLFYSSRDLRFTNPGADQGWYSAATVHYWVSRKHFTASYTAVLPEYSVIVNTDADENLIDVYNVKGGPVQHRVQMSAEIPFGDRFAVNATYLATLYRFNYGETLLQQPLLPKHRGLISAKWTSESYRWTITAEGCYTGAQRLPLHGWSKAYATANLLLKYKLSNRFTFMLNGFNLFNYRQPNATLYSGTPGQFDGWMQWAPLTGTSIQAGVTWKFR